MKFRPMLAEKVGDLNKLKLPVLASPKIDGIRCAVVNNIAYSGRDMKQVPNGYIANFLQEYDGLDGELTVGPTFQTTCSGVMTEKGKPDFVYHVFDLHNLDAGFETRYLALKDKAINWPLNIGLLPHFKIESVSELERYEETCLTSGYEGVMIRSLNGPYKFGRSTVNEGYLLKMKRFTDSDAIVIGFEQLMHNANIAGLGNTGLTERSSCQDGLIPGNLLGSLVAKDLITDVEFSIGTGFTAGQRKLLWAERTKLVGRKLSYKYQKHGMKDKPRCPVFLRWRPDL